VDRSIALFLDILRFLAIEPRQSFIRIAVHFGLEQVAGRSWPS
jgi:hypothetical protein